MTVSVWVCTPTEVALTCYTSIFTMPTVVAVDPIVAAFQKRCFPSSAPQVIKEYLSWALTKMSTLMGCYCSSVSKLAAYNMCITNVPVIVTYSVPLTVVPNLDSSLSWCAPANQSNKATFDTYSKSIPVSTARNCNNVYYFNNLKQL